MEAKIKTEFIGKAEKFVKEMQAQITEHEAHKALVLFVYDGDAPKDSARGISGMLGTDGDLFQALTDGLRDKNLLRIVNAAVAMARVTRFDTPKKEE